MRKTWAELTADEKAEHRRFCIENARDDIPKEQVERVVDLLDIAEFDWEQRRQAEALGIPVDLPLTLGGFEAVLAVSMRKKKE